MTRGHRNVLAKQIAEHLVCAELGRRGFVATPFSGNVPIYDVLAADESGRAVSIQVKATRGDTWRSNAQIWMTVDLDVKTGMQTYHGPTVLQRPDLIYVCVIITPSNNEQGDRFFILTMADLQVICVENYTSWMSKHDWRRPRKPESFDLRYSAEDIQEFEDNWTLISQHLQV